MIIDITKEKLINSSINKESSLYSNLENLWSVHLYMYRVPRGGPCLG